jgi:hypothetical protein
MSLKDIFTKAFRLFGKKATELPPELPSVDNTPPSPYAKLLEADIVAASSSSSPAQAKPRDVFLLENLTAKPKSTVGLLFSNPGVIVIRDPYRGSVGRLMPWKLEGKSFPLYGDWFGAGAEAIGFFHVPSRYFLLWRSDSIDEPEIQLPFGPHDSNWIPLAGDWNGDGIDGVGFYDPDRALFMLRNQFACAGAVYPEISFSLEGTKKEWLPVSGDWDGDGKDGVGLFDPETSTFYLRDDLSDGPPQYRVRLGKAGAGCVPLAGDWNGDGVDGIGCYECTSASFQLRNALTDGEADIGFTFGPREVPGMPFSGRWVLPDGAKK